MNKNRTFVQFTLQFYELKGEFMNFLQYTAFVKGILLIFESRTNATFCIVHY